MSAPAAASALNTSATLLLPGNSDGLSTTPVTGGAKRKRGGDGADDSGADMSVDKSRQMSIDVPAPPPTKRTALDSSNNSHAASSSSASPSASSSSSSSSSSASPASAHGPATGPGGPCSARPPWGRLVPLNPRYSEVPLGEDILTIGRSNKHADVLVDHKSVSGRHCRITRERDTRAASLHPGLDHVVQVTDMSTNGTWIDGVRLTKGGPAMVLRHGAELSLVLAVGGEERVSYLLHDLAVEAAEESKAAEAVRGRPMGRYYIREVLGTGAFAMVRLVVDRKTGEKFAMKIIKKKAAAASGEDVLKEVELMMKLNHAHIVHVREFFDEPKSLSVVMDLQTGGDLCDRVINHGACTEEQARVIMCQLVDAVAYLHSKGVVHRDLKPENVLLASSDQSDLRCYLTDFGISRMVGDQGFMKTVCGTPAYLAPEVLKLHEGQGSAAGYSAKVDVWSLGAIAYVLVAGDQPFGSESAAQLLADIAKPLRWIGPSAGCSAECKDLIVQMLQADPAKRMDIGQVKKHPWLLPREHANPIVDESF
jgi:hypothetical protein